MALSFDTQTFTVETGEQALIVVSPKDDVTIGIQLGSGDVVRIEHTLTKDGFRYETLKIDINAIGSFSITGPIFSIGINIITNSSNDIKAEFFTSQRFG